MSLDYLECARSLVAEIEDRPSQRPFLWVVSQRDAIPIASLRMIGDGPLVEAIADDGTTSILRADQLRGVTFRAE